MPPDTGPRPARREPTTALRQQSARLLLPIWASIALILLVLQRVGPDAGHGVYVTALGPATLVVVGLSIWAHRPAPRWPWLLIFLGVSLLTLGYGLMVSSDTLGNLTAGRSFTPDAFMLPGYLLVSATLYGLTRARGNGHDVDAILDATSASAAAFLGFWLLTSDPSMAISSAPLPVRFLIIAYPTCSFGLLAGGIRFTFTGPPVPATRLLVAGMGVLFAGNVGYMLLDARMASVPAGLVSTAYVLAYVLFGAAIAHPSVTRITAPVRGSSQRQRQLLAIISTALAVLAPLASLYPSGKPRDRAVSAVVVVILAAIAVSRIARAITAQNAAQRALEHQATHDHLTGLPNRAALDAHLQRLIERADRRGIAVLFSDLDRFKDLNDTFGHPAGDALLVGMTRRLLTLAGPGVRVFRQGGDEFVTVAHPCTRQQATELAARIRDLLVRPFKLPDVGDITASTSIGIAYVDPSDYPTPAVVVRDADTALYAAKDEGRDRFALFDATMRSSIRRRTNIERHLRLALADGDIAVAYQPIVDLGTGRIRSVEALARWTHPDLGPIPPDTFVPVAELTGQITALGNHVLATACADVARWRREQPELANLRVSVNFSGLQLADSNVHGMVVRVLAENHLPPDALILELTESSLIDATRAALASLEHLRTLGVIISVDDFGTGYSSLAYLKKFPIGAVKIDRAFVGGIDGADTSAATLVSAIVAMAEALGMYTVAEGVETREQAAVLTSLGCRFGQGYLYSPPVPADELPQRITDLQRPTSLA